MNDIETLIEQLEIHINNCNMEVYGFSNKEDVDEALVTLSKLKEEMYYQENIMNK